MKLDAQGFVDALKAKGLPVIEKDGIMILDTLMDELLKQAMSQPGDAVAGVISILVPVLKPVADQQLEKLAQG